MVSALGAPITQIRLRNQPAGNHEWCTVKTFTLACVGARDDLT